MSLEGTGHPQTVNVHISIRLNRNPGVFRRDIFDKALTAFHTLQKNKSLIKSVCQPGLLRRNLHILIIGNGTADVLLFQIILCDSDIFHTITPSLLLDAGSQSSASPVQRLLIFSILIIWIPAAAYRNIIHLRNIDDGWRTLRHIEFLVFLLVIKCHIIYLITFFVYLTKPNRTTVCHVYHML